MTFVDGARLTTRYLVSVHVFRVFSFATRRISLQSTKAIMLSFIKTGPLGQVFALGLGCLACATVQHKVSAQEFDLKYKTAPIDNPLKGLVPYAGKGERFPNSLEFSYFPIRDLMKGPHEFDWTTVERKLDAAKGRGCQMVIRVYLEFPGKKSGMPAFLTEKGVKITKYEFHNRSNHTPDYSDLKLIAAMKDFIVAFGKKYDADPRLGFITMGVLGHWGEWHTYPKEKLFASKTVQAEIMDVFESAFPTTKVLMRYPVGDEHWKLAPNHLRSIGFHDDSFSWATLDTGKKADSWFFETSLKAAGEEALEKWKTEPIGGEIRPEVWGCVFDQPTCAPKGQEFGKCVAATHVSWLMDSGMFSEAKEAVPADRVAEATRQVQKMGYELFVRHASISWHDDSVTLKLAVENQGVAPFYYDWPVEVGAFDSAGKRLASMKTGWKLTKTLPGSVIDWTTKIQLDVAKTDSDQPKGIRLAIRVVNPMQNGKPLRFANETQQSDGWLWIQP